MAIIGYLQEMLKQGFYPITNYYVIITDYRWCSMN